MSKEDNMDKTLKLQLSVNEEASGQVAKISKSYLVKQRIFADGDRVLANKQQEETNPEETKIIIKSVQSNSTANRQRTNDSNQYLYERGTRVTAEERTVVTKLTQLLEANRPDESKTMAKLSKQEAKNRTAFTATISKEISILSIIPATTTNKNGTDQDEQLKRENPAEEMKEATQENQNSIQLSINEAYIKSNLYEEESEVKSAIDEREFNILSKQHELKLSEESTMEHNNQSKAKFTITETKNQRDNTWASYLLKDGKPQIQFNSAETKGSQQQASCTDESRGESMIQSYEQIKKQVSNGKRYHGKSYKQLAQ